MNSCRSSEFWAWAPPLITFSIGTGRTCAPTPPIQRNRDTPAWAAPAFAVASETPRIALAPRRDLFFVPSSSINVRSSVRWSSASSPATAPAISVSTFRTALRTLLPRYDRSSPSRNSTASNWPVDAPEGTAARPVAPDSSTTSTSTVGFPRESRICLPCTRALDEAARHRTQREFRIHVQAPRDVDGREEHVSHLREHMHGRLRLRRDLARL